MNVWKTDLFRGRPPCYVVTCQDVFGILTIDGLARDGGLVLGFAKRQGGCGSCIGYTHRIRGRINRFRPATTVEQH